MNVKIKLVVCVTFLWLFFFASPFCFGNHSDSASIASQHECKQSFLKPFDCSLTWEGDLLDSKKSLDKRPLPKIRKFFYQLRHGNLRYLTNRLWLEIKGKWMTNKGILSWVLWVGLSLIIGYHSFSSVRRKKLRGNQFFVPLIHILLFLVLFSGSIVLLPSDRSTNIGSLFRREEFKFRLDLEKPVGSSYLTNENNHIIGTLVWTRADLVEMAYECGQDTMSNVVDRILAHDTVFAITSASYFDESNKPVGFLAHKSELINPWFIKGWDGLVVLKSGEMQLVRLDNHTCLPQKPVTFSDKGVPCNIELADQGTTAFQLPLLVFDQHLLLDYQLTPFRLREMRWLCGISEKKSGELFYLVLNFDSPCFLANAAYSMYDILAEMGIDFHFALLFDVGSNNFLRVYNFPNQPNHAFRSLIPPDYTNNLLIITLKNPVKKYGLSF